MGYWDTHPIVEGPVIQPEFIPSFRVAWLYTANNKGGLDIYPANSDYFAEFSTAQWIANKYGDGKVYALPFDGAGGPTQCSENIYCTKVPIPGTTNLRFVNCGILAKYYIRNPQPGLAETLIRMDLSR